jgi:hypothetical protein
MWPPLPSDHPHHHRFWPGWCGYECFQGVRLFTPLIVSFQKPPRYCYIQCIRPPATCVRWSGTLCPVTPGGLLYLLSTLVPGVVYVAKTSPRCSTSVHTSAAGAMVGRWLGIGIGSNTRQAFGHMLSAYVYILALQETRLTILQGHPLVTSDP